MTGPAPPPERLLLEPYTRADERGFAALFRHRQQ